MESVFPSCVRFLYEIYSGRDKSHDLSHALSVWHNSLKILYHDSHENLEFLITIVSLFHDAFDRKYDHDGTLRYKTAEFLSTITCESQLIMDIIDRISYTREKRLGRDDWLPILGEKGLLVRNIVSDADKLEALGEKGYYRCKEYNKISNPKLSQVELLNEVHQYLRENNLQLKDNYMCTSHGKHLADSLHNELIHKLKQES